MAMQLRSFFTGPEWAEISIPDWFKERSQALSARLGAEHPELALFTAILNAGRIEQDAVVNLDQLAGSTQDSEVFLLAVDLATHAFTVMQSIALIAPRPKAA